MSWKDERQQGVRGKNILIPIISLDKVLQTVIQYNMAITKKVKKKKVISIVWFFSEEFMYNCMRW